MPSIRGFLWDDESVAHLARHAVSPDEVEEAPENDRWVFAVYVTRPRGRIRVLTARDMTERERRLYQRKRRGRL
jgi:hypothetical protein